MHLVHFSYERKWLHLHYGNILLHSTGIQTTANPIRTLAKYVLHDLFLTMLHKAPVTPYRTIL